MREAMQCSKRACYCVGSHFSSSHGGLGLFLMIIVTLQAIGGFMRPVPFEPLSTLRKVSGLFMAYLPQLQLCFILLFVHAGSSGKSFTSYLAT